MAKFDYKSKELADLDLFDGEEAMNPLEYAEMRKNLKRPPRSKDPYPSELKGKTPITKDFDIAEYKNMLKSGEIDKAWKGISSAKPELTFFDDKKRRVELYENSKGGLAIKFFCLPQDHLGFLHTAISRRFEKAGVIPRGYGYTVDILSANSSVCIYLPPQNFAFGFKMYLAGELTKIFG